EVARDEDRLLVLAARLGGGQSVAAGLGLLGGGGPPEGRLWAERGAPGHIWPGAPWGRARGDGCVGGGGGGAQDADTRRSVSRVTRPARSIGLLRLQRAGTMPSIAVRRSSGRGISSRPAFTQASDVSTPQPPATVKIKVRGPRGSGWVANAAAAS